MSSVFANPFKVQSIGYCRQKFKETKIKQVSIFGIEKKILPLNTFRSLSSFFSFSLVFLLSLKVATSD